MRQWPTGLQERLVKEAMDDYRRALPTRALPRNDRRKQFRRWLDVIVSHKTGAPLLDDEGGVLRRFGPPLAWFDSITSNAGHPRGMAADLDFFLERNGLYLVMEFKSARGERRLSSGGDKLGIGQWRSLATLAKTGLFVVYVVEFSDAGGNDAPPTITRVRRLLDDVAKADRWHMADFGDLLCRVHEWWTNAGDAKFVRRQKAAACYAQTLQHILRIAPYSPVDSPESIATRRVQHEALRLAARDEREGRTQGTWSDFQRRFEGWVLDLTTGAASERSSD